MLWLQVRYSAVVTIEGLRLLTKEHHSLKALDRVLVSCFHANCITFPTFTSTFLYHRNVLACAIAYTIYHLGHI